MRLYELYDLAVGILIAHLLPDLIVKVRAVERAFKLLGVGHSEVGLDVYPHLVGSGGREGYHRDVPHVARHGYLLQRGLDVAVLGTEVVSPLRNAVSLVHGYERDLERLEERQVVLLVERLRSHIEQLRLAALDVALHAVYRRAVERGVEVMGHRVVLAVAIDDIHLVLHQGYKGRHHDSGAFHKQRRQLVAEALASSCGHEHKGVVTLQEVGDDGFLVALEGIEAKIFLQRFCKIKFHTFTF